VSIEQGVVILAEIGTTDLRDVEHTNSVLESSGKTVVGILLVQSSK
jgi:Mrp family chromosome partitioning ATPase